MDKQSVNIETRRNPAKDHRVQQLVAQLVLRELQLPPEYAGLLLRSFEDHEVG